MRNRDWKFLFEKFILQAHRFEPKVKKALKKINGYAFVDIGANIGYYSLMLRRNFLKIYSFEPYPATFQTLQRRTAPYSNIVPMQQALSDREGEAALFTGFNDLGYVKGRVLRGSPSILNDWTYRPSFAGNGSKDRYRHSSTSVMVACNTFDFHRFGSVELVKIDVEGAEFLVLAGMSEALANDNIHNILIELHDRTRKKELQRLLEWSRFQCDWVDADHVLGRNA